jgi:hypothetical protein
VCVCVCYGMSVYEDVFSLDATGEFVCPPVGGWSDVFYVPIRPTITTEHDDECAKSNGLLLYYLFCASCV